jgi:hypothetical protein
LCEKFTFWFYYPKTIAGWSIDKKNFFTFGGASQGGSVVAN